MKKSIIYYAEQLSGSPHIFQYIDLDDFKQIIIKGVKVKNENNIIDHGGRYRFTIWWRN